MTLEIQDYNLGRLRLYYPEPETLTELLWNCFPWIVLGITYMTFLEGLTKKN